MSASNLSTLLYARGEVERAAELACIVLESRIEVLGVKDPDTIAALAAVSNFAAGFQTVGNQEKAEILCREALKGHQAVHGDLHVETLGWMLLLLYRTNRILQLAEYIVVF